MQVNATTGAPPVGLSPPLVERFEPSAAQLRLALAAAAEAVGVEPTPEQLRSAAELGARNPWTRPPERLAEQLAHVLARAGVRARRSRQPGPGVGPSMAVLPGPIPRLLVSRGQHGARLALVEIDDTGSRALRLSPRALQARYGSLFGSGAVTWLELEPALPLESLRVTPERGPRSPWARTRALLALDRNDIGVVLVYALAIGALTLATPAAVQALVNNVAFGTTLQPVVVLTLLLAVGLGFSAFLRAFQAVVVEVVQQRLFVRVLTDLARRLPAVEPSAWTHRDGRELANRFFDVVTVQKAVATLLVDGLGVLLQTVIGFALLAFYHPLLLAFDLLLAVVLVVVIAVLGRGAVRSAIAESTAKYEAAAWVETLAGRPLLFKTGHGPALAAQRADDLAHRYLDARRRHFRRLLAQTVGGLAIQVIASTALLGLGGALVLGGQLTLGELVAAELVVSALGMAFGKIGKSLEKVYDLVAAATKLGALVDLPLERIDGEPLRGEGPARLRVVEGATDRETLELGPGQCVGLVGGEAAERIIEAAAGLRPLSQGFVELDGVDLRHVSLDSLRGAVALVRNGQLLPGTVLDNLRLGRPDLELDAAQELLRRVGLASAVSRLPGGLEEPVGLGDHPLDEPQRRRLAVARALAEQPRLLVLDGVLDGIVGEGDPLLDLLSSPAGLGPTVLVRSRDPAVLARCDRVVARDEEGGP
ncbi:ATP-binding cassette domain-containing protein [Paraliomyxa miuraensis]|uniref:ATP-binding cassette domain-containing protein n=1 Tax=Paraliomyxa miuraensis TaxID=376150 RepID=UPI002256A3FF|nr:ABC transporter ATP-binding protein [Paraliomyxa miuraensis]MCX4239320.1 ABC transporter ATP-binding protein/permease [Paraliomyxa miuraensis]